MEIADIKAAPNFTGTTVRWVDTVIELKSIFESSGISNSQPAAVVGGYWAIGDGGGGVFYWDTSSSAGDNGVSSTQPGTIIVPTGASSGRWVRIYSGPIDVRWFGARGQGTDFDDSPAINQAVSVAGDSRAAVFIPRGVYRLDAALNMPAFVRLHGEGEAATFLEKAGSSAETIIFKSNSGQCEVAHLSIRPRAGSTQISGGAIRFSEPMGPGLIKLSDLAITAFQGIVVEGSGFAHGIGTSISEVTIERIKLAYADKGLKLCYAVNWIVQDIVLQSTVTAAPGSNIYGVWIDTETEGCIFNNIFSLGGEHSWRIARSINTETSDRGPSENRFYSCIGDNGTVSCMYISSLHRGIFTNCWCSVQVETSDAAVVLDSLDIWGVQWVSSQIVNVIGHGFKVLAATSFAIINSTFSEWDLNDLGHSAVVIYPHARTNFSIIGNQFIRDVDFGTHHNVATITVMPGEYNRYVVSNNISYSGTEAANLGMGTLGAVSDAGVAVFSKIVNNNL